MDGIKSARLRQCFHHANNSNINKKRQTRNWTIVLVFHVIYAMFRVTVICRGFKISHRHLQHCLPIVLIYLVTAGFCYPNNVLDTANTSDIFDLTADIVTYDDVSLQALIKWNSTNLLDHKLDVRLDPVPNEHCSINSCVAYGLKSAVQEILLPVDPMPIIDHPECSIYPGCTYNVTVESTDRTIQKSIILLVPECVNEICSCKHAKTLPTLLLNATMELNHLEILWKIIHSDLEPDPDRLKLESVRISVGIQNNPSLTWGGRYKNIENIHQVINAENNTQQSDGSCYVNLTEAIVDTVSTAQFLIRAHVIDNEGCIGKDSNITYAINNEKHAPHITNASSPIIWVIILAMLCTTSLGATFLWHYMKKMSRKNVLAELRSEIYQIIPLSRLRPSITFQVNDIYHSGRDTAAMQGLVVDEDLLEIPHSQLNMGHNIGKGAFGSVYFAFAENFRGEKRVEMAVKKLRKSSTQCELDEFYDEIAMMKSLPKHPNIIGLIGYCTARKPMLMVMEYCSAGDLLQYLRNLRNIHEVRSVNVSNAGNNSILQASDAKDNFKPSTSYYNTNTNETFPKYISGITIPNETEQLLESETEGVYSDKAAQSPGMVGKYLELIHSSANSSSKSVTDSDDVSCNTKLESIASMEAASNYLRSNGNARLLNSNTTSIEYSLNNRDLQSFALQIARGMSHLEERGIVHRDLAARNILITTDKVLKISDFGLSRNGVYVNARHKKVPVRWLAVETLRHRIHSGKSDVWSYGIVLWEIGTLGGMPYPNICNSQILDHLECGYRMQRPEICSEDLYKLMRQCWSENPDDRPSFSQIVDKYEASDQISASQNNDPIYVNFDQLAPNYIFPPTNLYEPARQDFVGFDKSFQLKQNDAG